MKNGKEKISDDFLVKQNKTKTSTFAFLLSLKKPRTIMTFFSYLMSDAVSVPPPDLG